jgi:hypothetical protein
MSELATFPQFMLVCMWGGYIVASLLGWLLDAGVMPHWFFFVLVGAWLGGWTIIWSVRRKRRRS